jgi:hypothetical protein
LHGQITEPAQKKEMKSRRRRVRRPKDHALDVAKPAVAVPVPVPVPVSALAGALGVEKKADSHAGEGKEEKKTEKRAPDVWAEVRSIVASSESSSGAPAPAPATASAMASASSTSRGSKTMTGKSMRPTAEQVRQTLNEASPDVMDAWMRDVFPEEFLDKTGGWSKLTENTKRFRMMRTELTRLFLETWSPERSGREHERLHQAVLAQATEHLQKALAHVEPFLERVGEAVRGTARSSTPIKGPSGQGGNDMDPDTDIPPPLTDRSDDDDSGSDTDIVTDEPDKETSETKDMSATATSVRSGAAVSVPSSALESVPPAPLVRTKTLVEGRRWIGRLWGRDDPPTSTVEEMLGDFIDVFPLKILHVHKKLRRSLAPPPSPIAISPPGRMSEMGVLG